MKYTACILKLLPAVILLFFFSLVSSAGKTYAWMVISGTTTQEIGISMKIIEVLPEDPLIEPPEEPEIGGELPIEPQEEPEIDGEPPIEPEEEPKIGGEPPVEPQIESASEGGQPAAPQLEMDSIDALSVGTQEEPDYDGEPLEG